MLPAYRASLSRIVANNKDGTLRAPADLTLPPPGKYEYRVTELVRVLEFGSQHTIFDAAATQSVHRRPARPLGCPLLWVAPTSRKIVL